MKHLVVLAMAVAMLSIGVGSHADLHAGDIVQVAQSGASDHIRRGRTAGLKCPRPNHDGRGCDPIGVCWQACDYNRNGYIANYGGDHPEAGEVQCLEACEAAQEEAQSRR